MSTPTPESPARGLRAWLSDWQARLLISAAAFAGVGALEWGYTVAARSPNTPFNPVRELLAVAGLWLLLAFVWSGCVTALARLVAGHGASVPMLAKPSAWGRRTWSERHDHADSRRLATLVGVAAAAVGFAGLSVGLTAHLVEHRHGAMLIALAAFAGQLAVLAAMTLAAFVVRRGALALLRRVPQGGKLSSVLSFPGVVLAAAGAGVVLGAVVLVRYWDMFLATGALALALPLLAMLVQEVLCLFFLGRWPSRAWAWALPAAGLALFGVIAQNQGVLRLVMVDAHTVRYLAHGLSAASDIDKDGSPSFPLWLDCAPFDGARHPLAKEVPGNGVDENCDGLDTIEELFAADRNAYERRPGPPPSIVLVTIDSLRSDHMGFMGYERDITPHLDKVAERSVIFTNAYSQDSGTGPSMWSLHTGKTPFQVQLDEADKFPPKVGANEKLLAEQLEAAGYNTWAVLCGGVFSSPRWNIKRGFDQYQQACNRVKRDEAPKVTHLALNALRTLGQKKEPFFLWVHYYDPHEPYMHHDEHDLGPEHMDAYDEEIRYTDASMAELWAAIDELQTRREVFMALSADHGENFGEHGRDPHARTLYREVTNVPLIVAGPDVVARKVDAPVALNDLYPTFLQLAGALVPEESTMTGQLGVLFGAEPDRARHIFQENSYSRPKRHVKAVVTERYRYNMDLTTGLDELYDLQEDPKETRNLIGSGLDVEDDLRGTLQQFLQTTITYEKLAN